MNFERKQSIVKELAPKRALLIFGPRRVGKTTLLNTYVEKQNNQKVLQVVGEDIAIREVFSSQDRKRILDFASPYDLLAIDEAQSIPNIGLGAKMLVDSFPEKTLILTGSSSFELSGQVGEPLTGRHFTLTLLPLAQEEILGSRFELERELEDFLIFGSYPEVLLANGREEKARILRELVSSYLFKDVLMLDKIKSPDLLLDILRALAHQVGSEVSLSEVARTVKTDHKTVQRYIDLLEKMFVIKRLRGWSRNLRNEISKKAKYYFLDNGVRNAIIGNFNALALRDDVGRLWENFIFMELYKQSNIERRLSDSFYFWRTHTGQEIDIVIESNGVVRGIECKWQGGASVPTAWREAYPQATFEVINRDTYLDVLLKGLK